MDNGGYDSSLGASPVAPQIPSSEGIVTQAESTPHSKLSRVPLPSPELTGCSEREPASSKSRTVAESTPTRVQRPNTIGLSGGRPLYSATSPATMSVTTVASGKGLLSQTERDTIIEERLREANLHPDDDTAECGLGSCTPQCSSSLATIRVFVFVICLLIVCNGMILSGYVNSVITTIEKRFEIGSTISALMPSMAEVGALISTVFITYLGSQRHIPRIIGIGACVIAFGAFLFSLPHFIAPSYTIQEKLEPTNTTEEEQICHAPTVAPSEGGEQCINPKSSGNAWYVLILVLSQTLIGIGSTPIMTLGTAFVDSHLTPEQAPTYISPMYACSVLGPVLGYVLGSGMVSIYVDVFKVSVDIPTTDSRWVGAWWAGFLICGALASVVAPMLLSFPRTLRISKRKLLANKLKHALMSKGAAAADVLPEEEEEDEAARAAREFGKRIKDLPRNLWRLMKNPVYAIVTLGVSCVMAIIVAFTTFLPKYLETQFGQPKWEANLYTGGVAVPGAALGCLIGGFILKKFKLKSKGALQLTLLLYCVALIGFVVIFFTGCDNPRIAGATLPYYTSNGTGLEEVFEANLTSQCNIQCKCSSAHIDPVCGSNGLTYFSPCHAGCTSSFSPTARNAQFQANYSNCACISAGDVVVSRVANKGSCKSDCGTLFYFLMALFIMSLILGGSQMPLLMITMRAVEEHEKAFALGMQFVALRLLAYIPAPLLFGLAIDSTCLVWNKKCDDAGACLIYDIEAFRHKYSGMAGSLHILGIFLFTIVWFILRKKEVTEKAREQSIQEMREHLGVFSVSLLSFTPSPATPPPAHHAPSSRFSRLSASPYPQFLIDDSDNDTPLTNRKAERPVTPPLLESRDRHRSQPLGVEIPTITLSPAPSSPQQVTVEVTGEFEGSTSTLDSNSSSGSYESSSSSSSGQRATLGSQQESRL